MAQIHGRLSRRLWRFSARTWLISGVALASGFALYSFFFIRREVVPFLPAHTFAVTAPEFFNSAHALADPAPVGGNQIELLHNGDQAFPAMLEAIRTAKKTVNFEAFLFYSGTVGSQFRDALCERARAGLRVRVLLDGVGSGAELKGEDVRTMKEAGCSFAYYHPTRSLRIDQINRRSHRRILVVDGRVGFTGGLGFADVWQGNGDSKDHWRDIHARIEGPLVAKLQAAFQQHWMKETGETLIGPDEFPELPPAGPLKAQLIASHSFSIAALPLVQAVAI